MIIFATEDNLRRLAEAGTIHMSTSTHEHARGTRAIARTHAACAHVGETIPVGVMARRRIACRRNGTKPTARPPVAVGSGFENGWGRPLRVGALYAPRIRS